MTAGATHTELVLFENDCEASQLQAFILQIVTASSAPAKKKTKQKKTTFLFLVHILD